MKDVNKSLRNVWGAVRQTVGTVAETASAGVRDATGAKRPASTLSAAPMVGWVSAVSRGPEVLDASFYRNAVLLDRERHKDLRLKPADARFAARSRAVPLTAAEFPEACLEYPIVFAKGQDGGWVALALTALGTDVNAFVDEAGRWNARHVPASVRRYPFILAGGADDRFTLAVDIAAPHVGDEGEPLFDDSGEPSELVRDLMGQLLEYQEQAARTAALAKKLDDAGLLAMQRLQVRLADGREAVVDGIWLVDEAKLVELPESSVLEWFRNGDLAAIHAHMLSLRNLVALLDRSQPTGAGPNRWWSGQRKEPAGPGATQDAG
jgi:hypothetical protein